LTRVRASSKGLAHAAMAWLLAWSGMWPWADHPVLQAVGIYYHRPVAWLQVVSLVAVFAAIIAPQPARATYVRVWWITTNWLAATVWWLTESMHVYGGLSMVAAALAVIALAGALALYMTAALGYVATRMTDRAVAGSGRGAIMSALAIAAAWTLAEWLRAKWFTGFPWGELGYAHLTNWGWLAPITGVTGVTALVVFAAAWVASTWCGLTNHTAQGWTKRQVMPWLAFALVIIGLPPAIQPSPERWGTPNGSHTVALVQGNVDQSTKFGSSAALDMAWYAAQVVETDAALTILPETAFPMLPETVPTAIWRDLTLSHNSQEKATLVGIPAQIGDNTFQNEAWLINSQSRAAPLADIPQHRYAKNHLVPFGELSPPGFRWFTSQLDIPLSEFKPGGADQPGFQWRGETLAVTICYEDVFGDEMAQRMTSVDSTPTAWVNMSNLAWFGDTTAIPSHLQMARWRALELGRPMLRATNTGATAVIDHLGRVVARLPMQTRGVLITNFEGRTGLTPYAQWAGRWGHTPVWVLSVLVLVFLVPRKRAE
jgi:apolipoprotein N-acyltransferase